MTDSLWSQPHHDGLETYVPELTLKLSGKVTVFLRVPRTSDVTSAWVRVLYDGNRGAACHRLPNHGDTKAQRIFNFSVPLCLRG